MKRFIWDLAKEGFVLQLVSLAGLHSNAVGFGLFMPYFVPVLNSIDDDYFNFKAELAQRFQSDGVLAYVETVQRKEKEIGCDVLTHQKWCASIFRIILLIISPHFFCFAGVERIILIEFCPRSHLGHRAPLRGGMILPNTHSSRMLFVLPVDQVPKA